MQKRKVFKYVSFIVLIDNYYFHSNCLHFSVPILVFETILFSKIIAYLKEFKLLLLNPILMRVV